MKLRSSGACIVVAGRWAALLLSVTIGVYGCSNRGNNAAAQKGNRPMAVHVKTAGIQRISIQRQVDLAGTLVSPDQARVSSEVAGVIREVLVDIGQDVRPGQALVRLDSRELEIALRRAESLVRQTEAQLAIDPARSQDPPPDEEISTVKTALANRDDARAQLARATQLYEKGLVPRADFDTAQTRVKVTEAAYQSALEAVQGLKASLQDRRAAVELAEKKLNDAVIRAPVGGSVSERLVQVGEFIRENTPVVTLVQLNPLKLRTSIQERYAQMLRPGLTAYFRVESLPDAMFEGKVINVSPAVEQTTRTFVVEVLVDNGARKLKPGFFAKGTITIQRDDAVLAVSESCVSTLAGVSSVFVVGQDNRVTQQAVTLGAREGELLEIVSGLEGSEILAASNLTQLATGTLVATGAAADGSEEQERSRRSESEGKGRGGER